MQFGCPKKCWSWLNLSRERCHWEYLTNWNLYWQRCILGQNLLTSLWKFVWIPDPETKMFFGLHWNKNVFDNFERWRFGESQVKIILNVSDLIIMLGNFILRFGHHIASRICHNNLGIETWKFSKFNCVTG